MACVINSLLLFPLPLLRSTTCIWRLRMSISRTLSSPLASWSSCKLLGIRHRSSHLGSGLSRCELKCNGWHATSLPISPSLSCNDAPYPSTAVPRVFRWRESHATLEREAARRETAGGADGPSPNCHPHSAAWTSDALRGYDLGNGWDTGWDASWGAAGPTRPSRYRFRRLVHGPAAGSPGTAGAAHLHQRA